MKKFDVAIAGGGVIGAAIAMELAQAGLRVGVFDRQQPGQEASWASAGILSPAPENPGMIAMVEMGKASFALYPEFVARVEEVSGKSTGFRPKGTLEALFSHDTKAELSTIIAVHHGLGLKAEPLRAEDARELEPALSEEVEAAVLRPQEASIDNRALTAAVLEAAQRNGAEIFPGKGAKAVWYCKTKKSRRNGRSLPQGAFRRRLRELRLTRRCVQQKARWRLCAPMI
jgi:glycine oxidase